MGESRDPDDEQASAYLRVPWPIAAAAIVVVIGLALGVGLWLTQSGLSRQQTPAAVVQATAAVVSTVRPVLVPTPTVQLPNKTAVLPTPTATASSNELDASPTIPASRPTIDPSLAAQVDAAYRRYWEVRARAMFDVDASKLPEVAANDHLSALKDKIAELRSSNKAIETYIDHNFAIAEADADAAKVIDIYTDKSFYVDAVTHVEVSGPANEEFRERYDFLRIDDGWRVVGLVRSSS